MDLFKDEENYFGVDLGASSFKMVQLKRLHNKPSLVTYGDIEVPFGLINSDSPLDQDKAADIIRRLATDARISSKNVVAGTPSSSVFASVINMPKLSHDELAHAIRYQADKYIPMALDQIKLDWYVIGPSNADGSEVEVLLVAVPITIANKYLNIFQKAGLELMALEVNAIGLTRSLLNNRDIAVVIVDFGALATDITVVSKQIPRLIRSTNIGSRAFVRVVAQNLGLDEVQAEQFMRKFGMVQTKLEGQVYKALKPALDSVVDEINKSVKFYQDHNQQGGKIEKLVITGGPAAMLELPVYLANATGITVEIGNPWAGVSYPSELQDRLSSISLNYATALGFAMRNMV